MPTSIPQTWLRIPPIHPMISVQMMSFSEMEPHTQIGGANLPPASWGQFKKWASKFSVCGFLKKNNTCKVSRNYNNKLSYSQLKK